MPATNYSVCHSVNSEDAGPSAVILSAKVPGGAVYRDPLDFAQASGQTLDTAEHLKNYPNLQPAAALVLLSAPAAALIK